jgi:hypothetical protein
MGKEEEEEEEEWGDPQAKAKNRKLEQAAEAAATARQQQQQAAGRLIMMTCVQPFSSLWKSRKWEKIQGMIQPFLIVLCGFAPFWVFCGQFTREWRPSESLRACVCYFFYN